MVDIHVRRFQPLHLLLSASDTHALPGRQARTGQTLGVETLCVYFNRAKVVYILYALNYFLCLFCIVFTNSLT